MIVKNIKISVSRFPFTVLADKSNISEDITYGVAANVSYLSELTQPSKQGSIIAGSIEGWV